MQADDWANLLGDTEHVRFFLSCKWQDTTLGPLKDWGLELRIYVFQAFADARPVAIWWGPSRVAIYNEPYVPIAGAKHPILMGGSFEYHFPEVSQDLLPVFQKAESTRKATVVDNIPLFVKRGEVIEERFFDGTFVPLIGHDSTILGCYNVVYETTRQTLTERRSKMLNLLSASTDLLTSTSVYTHIAMSLQKNAYDIPCALLFKVEAEAEDKNHRLNLIDSIALSEKGRSDSQNIRLFEEKGFAPLLRGAQVEPVTTACENFPHLLGSDLFKWGGHGVPPQYLTTIPLFGAGRLYGFLVVGNNPYRPIDDQYHQFISDLRRHATAAVAATIGFEEAKLRNEQLQAQLIESEQQIRYMAQHSDIGMMQLDLDGTLIWANEHYHNVINWEDGAGARQTFIVESQLLEEDWPLALNAWQQVLQGQRADTTELRLRKTYTPPVGNSIPSTALLSAFPYMEDGRVKSVMACMTEVSRLKWAESWQAQLAHDAQEAKRQQSEFMDSISHEVRNPLSAILQLADDISKSTKGGATSSIEECARRLEDNVEAARNILNCARHQKQILDDVLTLSRMDFASIVLAPAVTNLSNLVKESFDILRAEATANSISLQMTCHSSMDDDVLQFMCDPLRVTQILVNLLSNAIKFTKHEIHRSVTVTYGAASSNPRQALPKEIQWAVSRRTPKNSTSPVEWGEGEPVYLTFCVKDTGPGMTDEQMSRVFDRFEQATPRTSIKYGGSGLGLFISHSLAEKQNGGIGAASTPGKGSTFAFYVKARKVQSPNIAIPAETNGVSNENGPTASTTNFDNVTKAISSGIATKISAKYELLLVEDNLINQRVLRKQLVKAGCTVHVANHGREALEYLRSTSHWTQNKGEGVRLDAILMDWEMPVMDGLTCTREIRASERRGELKNHIEVIAVTANVRPEQVNIAKEAGVDDLMPKPFVVSELLQLISKRLVQ